MGIKSNRPFFMFFGEFLIFRAIFSISYETSSQMYPFWAPHFLVAIAILGWAVLAA